MKKSKERSDGAWVLVWRLELEENANQTEDVYPVLFENIHDAVEEARRVTKRYCRSFGRKADPDELSQLWIELGKPKRGARMSLIQLSDSDNLVFDLSYNRIRRKS